MKEQVYNKWKWIHMNDIRRYEIKMLCENVSSTCSNFLKDSHFSFDNGYWFLESLFIFNEILTTRMDNIKNTR